LLGPQSPLFFVVLLAAFAAIVWWMAKVKHLALRVLVALLAFIPAMLFGVAAVNKYYDYYQTWGSAIADLTNQNISAPVLPYAARAQSTRVDGFLAKASRDQQSAQTGLLVRLVVTGQASRITRNVYVYLPPQYFQPAYRGYRFPAIELIPGFPGTPQDWISVLNVDGVMQRLVAAGSAKPAVLIMPDANGGHDVSLQCLNQARGPQDATYLGSDLPHYIAATLRVAPPGPQWGIAGYSEGGFCAANLGLRYPSQFGFAGSMSGYFRPMNNQLGSKLVSPFGGNLQQQMANTPDHELATLRPGATIPRFWLGAGTSDLAGVIGAEDFYRLLQPVGQGSVVRLVLGGHNAFTWRELMPPMLAWMSRGLAAAASHSDNVHNPTA
jgi:enterochelin esterase-like enzyme